MVLKNSKFWLKCSFRAQHHLNLSAFMRERTTCACRNADYTIHYCYIFTIKKTRFCESDIPAQVAPRIPIILLYVVSVSRGNTWGPGHGIFWEGQNFECHKDLNLLSTLLNLTSFGVSIENMVTANI
jgi:hypothetical protein